MLKNTILSPGLTNYRASLQEVTSLAQSVADSICTIGVSLDRCSVPQRSHQQNLPVDNLEYGMGA